MEDHELGEALLFTCFPSYLYALLPGPHRSAVQLICVPVQFDAIPLYNLLFEVWGNNAMLACSACLIAMNNQAC